MLKLETGETLYCWIDGKGYPRLRAYSHGKCKTVSAFYVLMYICWGPAPAGTDRACHLTCDMHGCLNPFHGRWGTRSDNAREARVLTRWRAAVLPLSKRKLKAFSKTKRHPAWRCLKLQGLDVRP